MRILTTLGVLSIISHGALLGRTWTDKTGRKLEAEWVSENATEVTLAKPNGETFTYPIAKLSAEDQAFLKSHHGRPTTSPVGTSATVGPAKELTPDYSKAAPAKPHAPLNQRQWPVEIAVGTGLVNPVLLRDDTTHSVYRMGKFEFETGPGLSAPLVKEIARTFVAVGELIERLPWEMPPVPPKGDFFVARLYPKRSDYDAIAPPSSGGFYSLQQKVFHVPYESLGISKDGGGKWTKARDLNSDTLVHELTHMMMDRIIRHVPLWVTEGAAEYVETIPFEKGVMRTGMLPKALKAYVTHMESMPARAQTQYTFKASAKTMAEVLHLSAKQWHQRAGTEPPTPTPGRVQLFLPLPGNEIAARQHDLYMHACLLFYYFMHLDSPQRGDPMLLLFDRALDEAPKWRLFDEAVQAYQLRFAEYESAWDAFSQLPGVTKQSNGSLQYPSTLTPPQAPPQPLPPVDLSTLPDQDLGLSMLPVLIKGRSDPQLQKAFRDGFAKIGIALQ